jgi:hypothetical protein
MDPHNRQLTYHNAYGHVIAAQGGVEAGYMRNSHQESQTPIIRQPISATEEIILQTGFQRNRQGGLFEDGKPFAVEKWISIVEIYERMRMNSQECDNHHVSERALAKAAQISRQTAKRAIEYYHSRYV